MPIPVVNEELLDNLMYLLQKHRTIKELRELTEASTSTLYRYFIRLEKRGYIIQRVGLIRPTTYYIE